MSTKGWNWMENYVNQPGDKKLLGENWPRIGLKEADKTDPLYSLWMDCKEPMIQGTANNAFDLLKETTIRHPTKPALQWLNSDGDTKVQWNYEEFVGKIRNVAYSLSRKYKPGDRVVLCYEPGLDFFVGFWACLATGIIAVPVCPPDPFTPHSDTSAKLESIITDCDPVCVLTSKLFKKLLLAGKAYCTANGQEPIDILHIKGLPWLIMDKMVDKGPISTDIWDFDQSKKVNDRKSICFLQYTSGSTGYPKGVMVSHENLVENAAQCLHMTHSVDSLDYYKYSVAVSWLPTFHDMGLIGFHVSLMMCGVTVVNFSPLDFISSPVIWLKAMSRFRRVITGGPPFALDLCVRKVSEESMKEIDLSRVSGIVLGAEPIRQQTLEAFANKFSSVGFDRACYLPCYGLAENVLYVIGNDSDVNPPCVLEIDQDAMKEGRTVEADNKTIRTRLLVSSGVRAHSSDSNRSNAPTVVVVNKDTLRECQEGEIGEIWVTGVCKALGYWNKPKQTQETFGAMISAAVSPKTQILVDNKTTFLRTGDMGSFVNNQLFVTGRYKDALIFNGTNYYPHDVEDSLLQAHPAIKPGSVAAVSVEDADNIERLCILLELRDKQQQKQQEEHKATGKGWSSSSMDHYYKSALLTVAASLPTTITANAYKAYKSVRRVCGTRPVHVPYNFDDMDAQDMASDSCSEEVLRMRRQYGKEELSALLKSITHTVQLHFGIPVYECIILTPKAIKKTSSGKIRRHSTRNMWVEKQLAKSVVAYTSTEKGRCDKLKMWNPDRANNNKSKRKLVKNLSPVEAAEEMYESSCYSSSHSDDDSTDTDDDDDTDDTDDDDDSSAQSNTPIDTSSIREKIIELVKNEIEDEEVLENIDKSESHDMNLLAAGLDSLTITKLSSSLTREFKLKQPLSAFMFIAEPTLNGVAKGVVKLMKQQSVHKTKVDRHIDVSFDASARCPNILGIGTAVPDLGGPQELVMEAMANQMHLSEKRKEQLMKIGKGSAIETRHTVLKAGPAIFWGREGLNNDAGMDVRNETYKVEAPKLAISACKKALQDWGGNKKDITHVVSVSCTGIIIPGLEFQVMVGLDLSPNTERLSITFMGCFGALAGLKAANAIAGSSPKNRVLVVCCELCSLHLQMNEKVDNLIASALFSDGAGAFVVGAVPRHRETPIFQIHKTASSIIPNTLEMMSWELSSTGFIIGLSKEISGQIYQNIKKFCRIHLLKVVTKKKEGQSRGYISEDECTWAIHPGGSMIVQAIQEALGITSKHTSASWDTMRDYGNMSSATLVFVWDNVRRQADKSNPWVPSLAFGPGLNVEGALLRRC